MRYRIAGSVAVVCAIVALSACAGPTLKQFTSHPKQTTAQSEELRAIWLDSWLKDMSLLVSAGHRIAVAARAECGDRVKP